jgi:hypothetical protein
MRFLFAILATLALVQCASSETEGDDRFRVGQSPRAYVIINVAEAAENTSASYDMLWRRVEGGQFAPLGDGRSFRAETNEGGTIRIRGIPGEFVLTEVEPGTYALDSVFGVIREQRVNYIAQGLIRGPERPAFDVRPGEAVYLGIWQVDIVDAGAVARPWRLNENDLNAVMREQESIAGAVSLRETHTIAVPCAPRRVNNRSQRQVC